MIRNNVDISVTAEQAAAITTGLDAVQDSMTFLVSVAPGDKKTLFKLGSKSEGFVNTAMVAASEHADLLPTGILANMQRDEAIRDLLRPVLARLRLLTALVDGTYVLAGSDLMKNGTAVYQMLRLNGYQEGIDPLITELGARFRTRRTTEPEPEPEPAPKSGKLMDAGVREEMRGFPPLLPATSSGPSDAAHLMHRAISRSAAFDMRPIQ